MTTVVDLGTDGPRTHAFVIGVGRYPFCGASNGGGRHCLEADLASGFTELTSAPRSALDLAEWLMAEQIDNEIAPLGTIELLASPTVTPSVTTPHGTVSVEAPTFAEVQKAFDRWYERCDTHADNVALFFFSGHGCVQRNQLVLLEDVGESPLRFFANAIEIPTLADGMARCRARTQCFFIDACRSVPDALLDMADVKTNILIQPHLHHQFREHPIIFPAARGTSAFGVPTGRTVFTEALIQALSGGAAKQRDVVGRWEITTDQIAPAINDLLRWYGVDCQRPAGSGECSGTPIRRLRTPPKVPFRFGCLPAEALSKAHFSLVDLAGGFHLRRGPEPTPWEDAATATVCSLQALFTGSEFAGAQEQVPLTPPCLSLDLPVTHIDGGTR